MFPDSLQALFYRCQRSRVPYACHLFLNMDALSRDDLRDISRDRLTSHRLSTLLQRLSLYTLGWDPYDRSPYTVYLGAIEKQTTWDDISLRIERLAQHMPEFSLISAAILKKSQPQHWIRSLSFNQTFQSVY